MATSTRGSWTRCRSRSADGSVHGRAPSRLDAVEQPAGSDHVTAGTARPVPKLAVRRDDGDRLPISDRLGNQRGDRVVTASRSVDDPEAVPVALADPLPGFAFEH